MWEMSDLHEGNIEGNNLTFNKLFHIDGFELWGENLYFRVFPSNEDAGHILSYCRHNQQHILVRNGESGLLPISSHFLTHLLLVIYVPAFSKNELMQPKNLRGILSKTIGIMT